MFTKNERSSFPYWFAHWCAFQMTALNWKIWKPSFLLHDIEKPWLKLIWEDYTRVQHYHRTHSNHHIEWTDNHLTCNFDIDAFIIDNECSRFTKESSPFTAFQYITKKYLEYKEKFKLGGDPRDGKRKLIYKMALERMSQLGFSC